MISLDEYIEDMKDRLDQLKADWLEKQNQDPVNYPDELPVGDWDEQFNITQY